MKRRIPITLILILGITLSLSADPPSAYKVTSPPEGKNDEFYKKFFLQHQ